MNLALRRRGELVFLEASGSNEVLLCVSTRGGGVSHGPFASLNLGLHVQDCAKSVVDNRRRLAQALGFPLARMVCAQQVHGTKIAIVGEDEAGRGAISIDDALCGVDGMLTMERNLALTCFYADCVPLLYYCQDPAVCGVAHGGWRGTLGGISSLMIQQMRRVFGCRVEAITVVIGPAIGPCCYEVGEEVRSLFAERFCPSGGRTLDLVEINRRILIDAGLPEGNIIVSNFCTKCNEQLFYSYRRAANSGLPSCGRHGAIAMLL
jgi:YfiH family protein